MFCQFLLLVRGEVRRFLVVGVLASLLVPVGPAAAEDCPPAGGQDRSFAADLSSVDVEADVAVTGGGWGHGVGMSQYGAQGAALLGCSYPQILGAYYPGTSIDAVPMPDAVRVGFLDPSSQQTSGATATYTNEGSTAIPFELVGCDFNDSGCEPAPPEQPAGATWRIRSDGAGVFRIVDAGSGTTIWQGGNRDVVLRARHDGTVVKVAVPGLTRRVRWGHTEFDSYAEGDGKLFVVQVVTGGSGSSAMERYLWGLAEVPSSWPTESLRAQAVAARSYAMNRTALRESCRCQLYATTRDQHYTGWDHEVADSEGAWKAAVDATAGQVMRYTDADGARRIADGFYSSSHGGWSDAARDVWGGNVPYLQAVDTSRWEAASDNPRQRWTVGFTKERLASTFGFASFRSLTVEHRGTGGRPTVRDVDGDGRAPDGARAVGMDGAGETVERWYSGEQLRSRLGVYSGLVHVQPLSDVPFERLADAKNPHRFGTSVTISRAGWPHGSQVLVVARADDPADALAGASLAGQLDAPLLITPSHELQALVAAEVERLGVERAFLLGGEVALGPGVVEGLRAAGVGDVQRVAGPDRYATAAAIAQRVLAEPGEGRSAYLVYSAPGETRGWPDALSVSGTAARRAGAGAPWPVLITGAGLPDVTRQELERLGVTEVVLVGGTAVIPEEVAAQLEESGIATRRLAGDDRYGTSVAVASEDGAPPDTLLVATGQDFPDGLSAGALAGRLDVTLLLVPPTSLPEETRTWVEGTPRSSPRLLVSGGPDVVSDAAITALRDALDASAPEGGS